MSRFFSRAILFVWLWVASAACTGCVPAYTTHGYVLEKQALDVLEVGMSRQEVESIMGPPTAVSVVDGRDWYYAWMRCATNGCDVPRVVDQFIVSLSFDKRGRLAGVQFTDMSRFSPVTPSPCRSQVYGRQADALEQFLAGSVFNKKPAG